MSRLELLPSRGATGHYQKLLLIPYEMTTLQKVIDLVKDRPDITVGEIKASLPGVDFIVPALRQAERDGILQLDKCSAWDKDWKVVLPTQQNTHAVNDE